MRTVVLVAAASILQLMVLGAILVSGLIAPPWAVTGAAVGWLLSLVPFVRALRRRSWVSFAVPLVVFGSWVLVVTFGDLVLGWTA